LALFVIVYTTLLLTFFWFGARAVLRGPTAPEPAHARSIRPGRDAAAPELAPGE
jgi:cytochrome bd-type quinol oxidase subunit 1